MKRKILSVAGIFFIFASLFNVSCQNETPTVQDFALDTVLTLDKAEVSATAYPGMNFVSWLPVTNANSYVLYIYVGGNCISSKTYAFDDDLNYVDTNIKNDVEYTYFVEAESSSSTGRAVVTQNSMSDGNTVKAIVPPYNTKAFELANYETNKNNDFIVNSSNTNISSLKNKVSVSFPGKAYLTYEVSLIEQWSNDVYQTQYLYDAANNNVTLYTDFTVTQPGDYKVKIVAKSINSHFADSGVIKSNSSTRVYSQFLTAKFFYENYDEYEYNGKKYIRFIGDRNCEEEVLSDGRTVQNGNIYWVSVEPIKWMIDEKAGIALSKKILISGIQFCHRDENTNNFNDKNIKKFMDNYFSKDIIPSGLEQRNLSDDSKKQNPYKFSFDKVSEENIIRGCIESDIPVFLHGPSSEGKSARVKQIDPDCVIIYLRNATPESLNGKSVAMTDQATFEMLKPMYDKGEITFDNKTYQKTK